MTHFFITFAIQQTIMGIAETIKELRKVIPQHVKIIAVSKTMPVSSLLEAYNAGQRAFGENKVQELLQKQPLMPADVEWHMIGHLQTNKVKQLVPFINLIHSVDSLKLLGEINREAMKSGRKIDCLLQIHIASEETKFGLSFAEASALLDSPEYNSFNHINLRGLMGMASFTEDAGIVRKEFKELHGFFSELKQNRFSGDDSFSELSMGMSGDYPIAVETGSTMVRIGSLIFGERRYNK
jgi:pyridoxal phosphate enzyme (YggS family)